MIEWNTGGEKLSLDYIRRIQEPGNKFAMEIDPYFLMEFQRRFKLEVKILEQRIRSEIVVLYVRAHHRLFESFNEKFIQMSEAGFFLLYIEEVKEMYRRNTTQEVEEPFKVLTLEELEAGFVVSTVPLIAAIIVFCFEWIVHFFRCLSLRF